MFSVLARRVTSALLAPAAPSAALKFAPLFSIRMFSDAASSGRETGTVKWFDAAKGFGFITRESGNDVFVHFTSIMVDGYRTLEEGQRVEFAVAQGHKGLAATEVKIAPQ